VVVNWIRFVTPVGVTLRVTVCSLVLTKAILDNSTNVPVVSLLSRNPVLSTPSLPFTLCNIYPLGEFISPSHAKSMPHPTGVRLASYVLLSIVAVNEKDLRFESLHAAAYSILLVDGVNAGRPGVILPLPLTIENAAAGTPDAAD
jgi:hypothetical protein